MRRGLAVIGVAAPAALFVYLLANPTADPTVNAPVEHLVITTNVAVLAFFAGVLVARAALQLKQYRALLVALGFGSIGGIFAVHGLATPGVLLRADPDDALAVVALSAQLALLVPAVLFAVRYTSAVAWLERVLPARALVAIVVVGNLLYATIALGFPSVVGTVMRAILPSTTFGLGGYAGLRRTTASGRRTS